MPRYRVFCNFVVEADSVRDVIQYLSEEDDFVEKHLIIDEASRAINLLPEQDNPDDIYADISTK